MFALTSQFNSNSLPAPLLQRYSSADGAALKTAIFLLQNGEADVQQLCLTFGFSSEVALRSLQFWQAAGLITETDGKASAEVQPAMQPLQPAKHATRIRVGKIAAIILFIKISSIKFI